MAHTPGRRTFLSQAATVALIAGVGSLDRVAIASQQGERFAPNARDSDAMVFAAARRELSFSPSITFCNTGTFGASPREVTDAVVNGYRAIERDLPAWNYRPTPTEPGPISHD
jgi:hypothetical protein